MRYRQRKDFRDRVAEVLLVFVLVLQTFLLLALVLQNKELREELSACQYTERSVR